MPDTAVSENLSPSRYIEKVSLTTGEVLDDEILPKHLLVHNHRDYHVLDVQARRMMSRIVRSSGDEDKARRTMKEIRRTGLRATEALAKIIGKHNAAAVSKALLGLKEREYYFRFKKPTLSPQEIAERIAQLREQARAQFAANFTDGHPALRILLTGGTGFLGQEFLWQAAHDDAVAEVVVLIRPRDVIDRKTKQVVRTLSPAERGAALLTRLGLDDPEQQAKFTFVAGDVEQPKLGVSPEDLARLQQIITHVVHCAASVSFEDPYDKSFRINVNGTLNALDFSHTLQSAPQSPFIAHIGIETSYIHGRQFLTPAREDELVFPRNYYNNYYELTKAMATIETERYMLEKDLRVVQLCPAIVIGNSRTGNNWGDTKVVNAPVNLFGRAQQALATPKGGLMERSTAGLLARMACVFPADPSAELNLVPVDWVVMGILASLRKPDAVGERIHLATDNRISPQDMGDIFHDELGITITMAEPTLHRNVTLPVLTRLLKVLHQERVADGLERLSTIFGSYSEWGQPVHEVGHDVDILGLPEQRPNTKSAFRMLTRHNFYVQQFGQVRDLDEIARREKVWRAFVGDLEKRTGQTAGEMPTEAFRAEVEAHLDLERFELKD